MAVAKKPSVLWWMHQKHYPMPHLDLISQYIFKYIYDSPDPTMPTLLGSRDINSDIHQTAFQTLSTTVGGICRGDCDDLSELGELIVEKQNKIGHVVSLPGHAALAWQKTMMISGMFSC